MTEKHLILEQADPAVFFGPGNANLRMLRALCPKLRIIGRDNVVKVMGDEEEIGHFETLFTALEHHCARHNVLTEEDILGIIKHPGRHDEGTPGVIVYTTSGKPVTARSENQQRIVEAFRRRDMVFAVGPAGSGKTYTAIALAVRALKDKTVKKIVLCRPAVEAGEKLGFLPGDMKDKIDPYLQPLYDALEEMIPAAKLQEHIDNHVIQIAPLAFMRGRTLNDAVVILDEAQNTTTAQIKMFLTRMGRNTKMIVTGDRTQIDLPARERSGLIEAMRILKDVEGIAFIETDKRDIVRHRLVTRIVEAYEAESRRAKAQEQEQEQEQEQTDGQQAAQ
ncbi:MAG: PhoH family protein [Bacteroidales bacterium]|nr:PhoH family protein [Bacteroidales bacterium]MCI6103876.1 PhoH family protein [Bacteroidales bacterium]MCI7645979.1 PhoH family protein [Bacteroidales bacterium]